MYKMDAHILGDEENKKSDAPCSTPQNKNELKLLNMLYDAVEQK